MLQYTVILLATAALMAAVSVRLRIPALLGYLVGGIILGPSSLGWIVPGLSLDFLAELGIVLLMFMVGMEFSVQELAATWRRVLVAGGIQVLLTSTLIAAAAIFAGATKQEALLLGGALAMSSTAIAAKYLSDKGELTARHGRIAFAILIFQDIASIPMLTVLSVWTNQQGMSLNLGDHFLHIAVTLGLFILAGLLARPLLYRFMGWVSRYGTSDTFLLSALTIVSLTAYRANEFGLSPALGAFLAGLIMGESDFRHRIEEDLRPFKDLLTGLFFMTVGLRLDAGYLIHSITDVLYWLLLLVPGKILLSWIAARSGGLSKRDAWRCAFSLGNGGELGLLVVSSALAAGILNKDIGQASLVAIVISMGLAPIVSHFGSEITERWKNTNRSEPPQSEESQVEVATCGLNGHVIICGGGRIGRLVARVMSYSGTDYVLIESNYEKYQEGKRRGLNSIFGNASRSATLRSAGGSRARAIVVTFGQEAAINRIVHFVQHDAPNARLIVSVADENEFSRIRKKYNILTFPENFSAGMELAGHALMTTGLSAEDIEDLLGRFRNTVRLNV